MASETLNSLGLQVTLTRLRSMGTTHSSGMPSAVTSSSTLSNKLPSWRLANEQIVSNAFGLGWFPQ